MLPGTCSGCWLGARSALLTGGTDVPEGSPTAAAFATAPNALWFGNRPHLNGTAVRGVGGAG
eukprot:4016152-Lingulodinium_polyedra.AAC.1